MIKFIVKVLKRVILSSFLIFGYNTIVQPINIIIPLNIYTTSILSILGIPGFLSLILLKLLVY